MEALLICGLPVYTAWRAAETACKIAAASGASRGKVFLGCSAFCAPRLRGPQKHVATASRQLDRAAVQEQVAEIVRQLLAELGSHQSLQAVRGAAHLDRDLGLGSLE